MAEKEASGRKPHVVSCVVPIYITLFKKKTEENKKKAGYDSLEPLASALPLRVK